MPQRIYDLNALTYELRTMLGERLIDARDLNRASALVLDHLGCTTGAEAFELLYADWKALPRGTVMSGMRAGEILQLLPMLRLDQRFGDPGREEQLLLEARAHGPSEEGWQRAVVTATTMTGVLNPDDPKALEAAIARVEEQRAMSAQDSPQRNALDYQHAALRTQLAQLTGGEDDFDTAVDDMARLAESPAFTADQQLAMSAQLAGFRTHQAARRNDEDALEQQIQVMESLLSRLSADHMDGLNLEAYLDVARGNLEVMRARRLGRMPTAAGRIAAEPLPDLRRRLAALPREARIDRLGELGISRGMLALGARDHRGMLEAQGLLEEALDLLDDPDDTRWIRNAYALGQSHCSLAVLSISPHPDRMPHLDQGIAWLRHVWRLTGGPEHPLWGHTGTSLADAFRFRGDVLHLLNRRAKPANHAEARRIGLTALKAAAWTVLLQSGTTHAAETARRAGADGVNVARWCLADGAHAEAVSALDAGRGLTLHAATITITVPEMLASLGQDELAHEWRRASLAIAAPAPGASPVLVPPAGSGGPDSRLRRRVLRALAASPLRQRLLDTPSPERIGQALRALGAKALVYLVPADEEPPGLKDRMFFGRRPVPGQALIVTADGTTQLLDLPHLSASAPALSSYRSVGSPGRDAGGPPLPDDPPAPASAPDADSTRAALERLCDWAGTAVMEPLLRALPRDAGGGTASLVLVPMAELGVVPWHAARLSRGRRVCQVVDVSYMPSARLLCEVAARPATGAREALIVGDPTRDLHHAGEEAEAIHRAFHPGSRLLRSGTATPDAVTKWLEGQRGGLLHLACHGVVHQGSRHSAYLALSGGNLGAEQLTEGITRYRQLDLVVLAACRTNVSGHGYDEAYSLSTAFLVAGARSVIGSLWLVPDEATSLLMYMTHHYLCQEGRPPGQALRGAQMWMLDDLREPPPGMPAPLRSRVARIRSDDLTAWAGFTHLGW
ncbi:CHAT domain-containing protein [Streptomyces sp. NPDC048208]|uniref:CHAT domain-containing protein n=1 Tax=Streptomyces sp. NPDC048208 TaxID=3365515 RepID=UPI00371E9329